LVVDSSSFSKGTQRVTYNTPLISASATSLENVKLLVAAGADVNLHTPENFSPLYVALISGNFDIMEELINHNADFKNILIPNSKGEKMDILESIDKLDYTPNSERHKRKMAFISFLKSKGLTNKK
jgi:ankyrin repeat protein